MIHHARKVTLATGKAAWIAGTAFLVLIVPLIIEMDREQQIVELEAGQMDALTGGFAFMLHIIWLLICETVSFLKRCGIRV